MIKLGSRNAGEPCEVRLAIIAGKYDLAADFSDVHADGIEVREYDWKTYLSNQVTNINVLQKRSREVSHDAYYLPEDGINNFMDSDLWLVVSDRLSKPLAPVRPYVIFATDYIQRYVPEIFPKSEWGVIDLPFIQSVRAADGVIVTTPQTGLDAISYAGVSASKIHLAPMDFDPTAFPDIDLGSVVQGDYFIWPTNTTQHKNHLRAFDALRMYYERLGGQLRVKITGPNTNWMNPQHKPPQWVLDIPYVIEMRKKIESSSVLREKVEFCGELADDVFARTLAGAQFLWHPTLIDNGTFAVAEAAWFGCPSLSSGYPQMRYIGERFSIPMTFFNASSVDATANALKAMEHQADGMRSRLPGREALLNHSWRSYADEYWQMLQKIAA
jgi:glycosyltransferase involved in cell wall biosynthesis